MIPGMSGTQHETLHQEYWFSDSRVADMASRYQMKAYQVPGAAGPLMIADTACPSCGNNLVWTSRQSRKQDRRLCGSCGHIDRSWACRCDHCATLRGEERQRRAVATRNEALEEQEQ